MIVKGRLSNPVEFRCAFGAPSETRGSRQGFCTGADARFTKLAGVDFLAREVAIAVDTGEDELRVLHLDKENAVCTVRLGNLRKPHAVATVSRLDWSVGAERGKDADLDAQIAITEVGSSTVLLANLTQKAHRKVTGQRGPYQATAVRIIIAGDASPSQACPVLSVCAKPVGRFEIGVLRQRRQQGIDAGDDSARDMYAEHTKKCTVLFVARGGYAESGRT